jgi:hypothetical protein
MTGVRDSRPQTAPATTTYIESGAETPSSPRDRAIVRRALSESATRKDSTDSGVAPTTWQSR